MTLLTVAEAAEHAGTTQRTIRRWLTAGLKHTRHRGRIYIDIADLNQHEAATRRRGGRLRLWDKRRAMS